jgi:hypothetical protein
VGAFGVVVEVECADRVGVGGDVHCHALYCVTGGYVMQEVTYPPVIHIYWMGTQPAPVSR